MHKSQSARNSRCISTVVAYFPTQNSARTRPLHDLATIFLYSSFTASPSVIELSIELSTLTCTGTTTMFECQIWISFSAKQALVLACCVEGNVLLVQSIINPLSTGQSKIGRRRPISLDYHCVNISQRIFINTISLERSFHYLNADTLFLKIGQEMTPLQPFEVTQLIDFALDRSTSVTCGRDFAHSITMVT